MMGFAASVFAGGAGAILMMSRARQAVLAFALSAIGAAITLIPTLSSGIPSFIVGNALSVIVGGGLAWYAAHKLR